MIFLILANVCFLIVVYNVYCYLFARPANFPPGPPKVPWFGSYIFMLLLNRKHLNFAVNRICKFYKTTVLGIYLGPFPVVIVNDSVNVKKVLLNRDFDGRPDILMGRMRHPEFDMHGIFFTDSDLWHEQRRFALRYLRDFGFGRRFETLEKEIAIQIAQCIDIVRNGPKYQHERKYFKNGNILMPYAIGPLFGNCVMATLLNETFSRGQMGGLYTATENSFIFQRKTDDYGKLYSIIPSFAKLFPELSDYRAGREASVDLYNYFEKIVDEQIQTYDENHERHFVDMYINKMRQQNDNMDIQTHFSYSQMILTCIDFVLPTLTTVPSTVAFLFQQIFHEPEVQQKIQDEIDHVIGQGRSPTLDDRINLPYTEACLREIMRFETLVPSGLPHKALVDTEFLGYSIPKGTIIMPALDAAMKDPTAWEDPHVFRPERFLDASGKLCLSKDISLPFGAGKRLCAGETFARNLLFLFTTAFLQAFSVRMPDEMSPIPFCENNPGTIRTPKDHWITVAAR